MKRAILFIGLILVLMSSCKEPEPTGNTTGGIVNQKEAQEDRTSLYNYCYDYYTMIITANEKTIEDMTAVYGENPDLNIRNGIDSFKHTILIAEHSRDRLKNCSLTTLLYLKEWVIEPESYITQYNQETKQTEYISYIDLINKQRKQYGLPALE